MDDISESCEKKKEKKLEDKGIASDLLLEAIEKQVKLNVYLYPDK